MKHPETTCVFSRRNLIFSRSAHDRRESEIAVAWGQFERLEQHQRESARIEGWNRVLDQLIEWGLNPSQLEDDENEAPLPSTITAAYDKASRLSDGGWPVPSRVVSLGDGGIAFRFDIGSRLVSVEIQSESDSEILIFENGKLTHRRAM